MKGIIGAIVVVGISVIIWRGIRAPLSPVVKIRQGLVQGIISTSRDGRQFYEFRGIKYGNAKRFEAPVEAGPWSDVVDASEYGPKCLQVSMLLGSIEGEEDCLYLNVFTPKLPSSDEDQKLLPVMVMIHGGHFTEGSGNFRADYLMDEEIVVVSMNYRLAALGFLSTNDEVVRGNQGMRDQVLALKWVRDNIHKFGGNKNLITLQGESAGSVSVHYHLLSPMSAGLFHRAIAQSGVAISPWALEKSPLVQAKRLGEQLNCPIGDSRMLAECLREKDAEEIVAVHREVLDPLRNPLSIFVPTVEALKDNCFLCESPEVTLRNNKYQNIPMMIGVNQDEGLIVSVPLVRNDTLILLEPSGWYEWAPKFLYYEPNDNISEKVRKFYFKSTIQEPSKINYLESYTKLLGDRHFYTGISDTINFQRVNNSKLYAYYYTYNNELSLAEVLMAVKGNCSRLFELFWYLAKSWFYRTFLGGTTKKLGICHSDELGLMFPIGIISQVNSDHRDYNMSKAFIKSLVQFCSGSENLEFNGINWKPLQMKEEVKYFKIDTTPEYVNQPYQDRINFWKNLFKKDSSGI